MPGPRKTDPPGGAGGPREETVSLADKFSPFDRVPQVWPLTVSPTAYAVLGCLAHHANREGVCWPSIARIRELTGYSSGRTIQTAIASLERAGLVRREPRPGHSSRYHLSYTPAGECTPQKDAPRTKLPGSPASDCVPPPQSAAPEQDPGTRRTEQDEEPRKSELLARVAGLDMPTLRALAEAKGVDLLTEARACEEWHRARPNFTRKLAAPLPTLKSWLERAKPQSMNSRRPISEGTMRKFQAIDRAAP